MGRHLPFSFAWRTAMIAEKEDSDDESLFDRPPGAGHASGW